MQGYIRAGFVTIIGLILTFVGQPWLYQNTFFAPRDVADVDIWIRDSYRLNASIVFVLSFLSQVVWHFLAYRFKGDERDAPSMKAPWWILLFFAVIPSFVTVPLLAGSGGALPSLVFLFFVDVMIIYWLATAVSSPRRLKFTPPGSLFVCNKLNFMD